MRFYDVPSLTSITYNGKIYSPDELYDSLNQTSNISQSGSPVSTGKVDVETLLMFPCGVPYNGSPLSSKENDIKILSNFGITAHRNNGHELGRGSEIIYCANYLTHNNYSAPSVTFKDAKTDRMFFEAVNDFSLSPDGFYYAKHSDIYFIDRHGKKTCLWKSKERNGIIGINYIKHENHPALAIIECTFFSSCHTGKIDESNSSALFEYTTNGKLTYYDISTDKSIEDNKYDGESYIQSVDNSGVNGVIKFTHTCPPS